MTTKIAESINIKYDSIACATYVWICYNDGSVRDDQTFYMDSDSLYDDLPYAELYSRVRYLQDHLNCYTVLFF